MTGLDCRVQASINEKLGFFGATRRKLGKARQRGGEEMRRQRIVVQHASLCFREKERNLVLLEEQYGEAPGARRYK